MSLADQIPGLAEALQRERELRELAFLGATEPIAGVPVIPLTLERLNLLMVSRNAYVTGGEPSAGHVAHFLWIVSRAFKPHDLQKRDVFIRSIAQIPLELADAGIRSYLEAALMDFVAGADAGGASSTPVVCWLAALVDTIAREYHWSRQEILTTPLAELAQYLRRIEQRQGGRPRNPISDAATAAWLRQVNAQASN